MNNCQNQLECDAARDRRSRQGNIVVISASILVMVFAFAAFSVDVGFIALTKGQMQSASDAATLAAGLELFDAWKSGENVDWNAVTAAATTAAVDVAAKHRIGDEMSATVVPGRDIRFGFRNYDTQTGTWKETWGTPPYNMAEVSVLRGGTTENALSSGGGPLPLFFAPVIGHDKVDLATTATSVMLPAIGFKIASGSQLTADVLPIALDLGSWNDLQAGQGSDNFTHNPLTGEVTPGSDGVLEVDLYPYGTNQLPPGNRGTVDIGNPNNSTADLKRQIVYGLNDADLSYFGGELRWDQGSLSLNGDTGISAGISSSLEQIKGKPRAIPIFTQVSGNGNNATYTIVKFVGIRIMDVKLSGNPKRVVVQPATFSSTAVIRGTNVEIEEGTILGPPMLLR